MLYSRSLLLIYFIYSVCLYSLGKNTGVGVHALLQGIFPTQGWNPRLSRLLNGQAGSSPPGPPGTVLFSGGREARESQRWR